MRKSIFILWFVLVASTADVMAQCPRTSEAWHAEISGHTAVQAIQAEAAWESVCKELTDSATHEWAGIYEATYQGSGEVQFRWAPRNGFAAIWLGCIPGVHDTNFGPVSADGSRLRLHPRLNKRRPWRYSLDESMVFVRWGERRYLVPESAMESFCEFTSGIEPFDIEYTERYLCHVEDILKPVADVPDVPLEYRRFLRKPIDARILALRAPVREVGEPDELDTLVVTARLDKGSDDGVRVGMRFAEASGAFWNWFTVIAVDRHTCTAEMRYYDNSNEREDDREPREQVEVQPASDPEIGTVLTNRPLLPVDSPD